MPDAEQLDEEIGSDEFDDLDFDSIEDMSPDELQSEAGGDVGFGSGIDTYETVNIGLSNLKANNWNPNEMASEEFNRLCESIEQDGFLTALQAVPVDESGENIEFTEDTDAEEMVNQMHHARIVGGEHRWSAAKVTGMTEIPVNLVPNKDEHWEKMATVRMNAISGSLDPIQFAELVEEQRENYDDEDLKHALGFAGDDTLYDSVLEDVKESVPDEIKDELEEEEDEIETISDLSEVLNRIFRNHGEELDYSMISFSYGGQDNIMYKADDELWTTIVDVNEGIKRLDVDAIEFWNEVLSRVETDDVLEATTGTANVNITD